LQNWPEHSRSILTIVWPGCKNLTSGKAPQLSRYADKHHDRVTEHPFLASAYQRSQRRGLSSRAEGFDNGVCRTNPPTSGSAATANLDESLFMVRTNYRYLRHYYLLKESSVSILWDAKWLVVQLGEHCDEGQAGAQRRVVWKSLLIAYVPSVPFYL
jgi:hypothetical protein